MTKCPKCRKTGQHVPGYLVHNGWITRCNVCLGWGVTTSDRALAWLDGCVFPGV